MKYDDEEKGILDALKDDRIELADPSEAEINAVKTAAKRTFKKNRRVTIRLYDP